MNVKIHIPVSLRAHTGNHAVVEAKGETVGEAIRHLTAVYPLLSGDLYAEDGTLNDSAAVYINEDDIRALQNERMPLQESDSMTIRLSESGPLQSNRAGATEQRFSPGERLRYSRHLILPDIGDEGQKKLKAARIVLIGLGGLGSPAALYLAACGVGELSLVDFDKVDLTNLHRQVLYEDPDIGASKAAVAKERLQRMNPDIRINAHEIRLTSENAFGIIRDCDVVIDGSDNFPTRYLVNDACVLLGKPYVYGSVSRFDGQVSLFDARNGPCYRCLFPVPPPPGLVRGCAEDGVLGILPGIIGSLQALEAIKLIVGIGVPLIGRLLIVEGLKLEFRELGISKDSGCPICGSSPTIRGLVDYEQFCGGASGADRKQHLQISAEELKTKLDGEEPIVLLDVREPAERDICSLGGLLIPLGQLRGRLHELHPSQEIIVYCKTGSRSASAVELLHSAGYPLARSLEGGVDRWAERIDHSLPRY